MGTVLGGRDRMSAVAGIKKVKKVTKTTTKKDGGETITETTTTMSRESAGNMGMESKVSSVSSSRKESRQEEFEAMFCHHCDDSLAGHRYVLRDDHPYCIKCYENVFANNCDECCKIIGIDSKDLSYKEKHWHEKCFVCCTCKNPIGTKSFIPKDHDIYCAKCYEDKFATKCIKCGKVITAGGVTYRNDPWHRECFTCTNCTKSLAGQRFTSREDKPYCAECFGQLFSKRCTACSNPITGKGGLGSTKFVAFETLAWHNDCFFCHICQDSMVGKGFIQDGDNIICPECARKKMIEEIEEA